MQQKGNKNYSVYAVVDLQVPKHQHIQIIGYLSLVEVQVIVL